MKKAKRIRSYSDYTLDTLQQVWGINNIRQDLALCQVPIPPSELLQQILQRNKIVPINSTKARSELLITPILIEWLNRNPNQMQYFSGNTFDVVPEKALKGRCDFLFTKGFSLNIVAPVVAIFEAKDDNVDHWYGQCGAEMYAAKIFNEQHQSPYQIIYGAVTNGHEWVFLQLAEKVLLIDKERYYLQDLSRLLGALQTVMEFYE